MKTNSGGTEQLRSEINALRQQIVEFKGIEQRCRQAEAALMACEKRNQLLGNSAPLGIFTTDSQGTITGITRKMLELHHWPLVENPESITQADFISMVSQKILADVQHCIERKTISTIEHSYAGIQAGVTHLRYRLSPIPESDGSVSGVMGMVEDFTEFKKTEEALRESESRFRDLAHKDNLTGLHNRRYLYQSLPKLVEKANASDNPVSLIFMDLDHFKQVVDTHGHLNGSRAIREVGQTIDACLEKPAYAVAYAGDEFVVVLPGIDQHQAMQKAYEIRSQMKKSVYLLDQGIEVQLQASFGIATLPQHATEINGLIAAADQALFTIKGAGKDAIGQFQNQ